MHPKKWQTPWVARHLPSASSRCTLAADRCGMSSLTTLVNFGALSSFIILNFAVFKFFFIKEKQPQDCGRLG